MTTSRCSDELFFHFRFYSCCFFSLYLTADTGTAVREGFKFLQNYSPEKYNSHPQNWCIARDKQGIIYVANQGGLLTFDGVDWKKIIIPNQTARSVTIDASGTVYVGGVNELGFPRTRCPRRIKICFTDRPSGQRQEKLFNGMESSFQYRRRIFLYCQIPFPLEP